MGWCYCLQRFWSEEDIYTDDEMINILSAMTGSLREKLLPEMNEREDDYLMDEIAKEHFHLYMADLMDEFLKTP